jgi:hypothetical protein
MSGDYRKGGFAGVIGHLGGVPVSIPMEFAKFVEYDGAPGFMEKRKESIPKHTYESGIRSFGFDIRYPDMAPVNEQTWKEKIKEDMYTTLWMSVGVLSNSRYQDRSPARMGGTLVKAWLKNAEVHHHYEEQSEKVYGLTVYIPVNVDLSRREPGVNGDIMDRNIYIHRLNDGGVDAYIRCSNIRHEAATCRHSFGLEPLLKADVDVRYRRALLSHWREIQDSTAKVILDFRVDSSKEVSTQPESSSATFLTKE